MNSSTKKTLTSTAGVIAAVAFVALAILGLGIYTLVDHLTKDTSQFDLADVSSPTGIVKYIEDNTLSLREYADCFPASTESAKTELIAVSQKQESVRNVLAICTDEQNGNVIADMMLVVSFNSETGEVRILPLGGDTYVPIDGHGWDKLCTTVAYGGPELAVNTVNRVFDLDIAQYAVIAKKDVLAFFEQIAPLDVEMNVRQAEIFANYFGWDCHPGINTMDAEQLAAMVSFRDYIDGATVNGEVTIVDDIDRMENIKMVARAVFRSLYKLDFNTIGATLDVVWNDLDTNCDLGTIKSGVQTMMASTDDERLNLTASSLPSLNAPTYVLVQPEGYEQPAVATLYNYAVLRVQINKLLYGASENN